MSLLLGFDFAMASSRFETRKTLVQEETDAIGNVAMRGQFMQPQDRDYGLTGRRRHISSGIFVFMICSVLATIIDPDQPRSGSIRVGEESMLRLQSSLDSMGR